MGGGDDFDEFHMNPDVRGLVNRGPLMRKNEVFLNDGKGAFTAHAGAGDAIANAAASWGVVAADLDGDGDVDVYVATNYGANELLLNDGAAKFTSHAGGAATARTDGTRGVVAADFDGDGDLDLYVCNGGGTKHNELLFNDGSATFTAATAATAGDAVAAAGGCCDRQSWNAAAADFDGDGDVDLYVTNDNAKNELLLNNGAGVFTVVTTGDAVDDATDQSTGAVAADFDGDGDVDLFVSSKNGANRLLLNDGDAKFAAALDDGGAAAFAPKTLQSYGATAADLDNDGDSDIVVVNYNKVSQVQPPTRVL